MASYFGMKYTLIDHTADTGIEIQAESLEALFQVAGEAFCDLICDRETIGTKIERKISITAKNLEELLHAFLNELLFLFDSEHFLFSGVQIKLSPPSPGPPVRSGGPPSPTRGEGIRLTALLEGEKIDPKRHKIKMGIKAVTWHQLKVWKKGKTWKGRVIFDV